MCSDSSNEHKSKLVETAIISLSPTCQTPYSALVGSESDYTVANFPQCENTRACVFGFRYLLLVFELV